MTMFEFMTNAFYLLCGVACIAVAFLIIYVALIVIIRGFKTSRKNAGYGFNPEIQRRKEHGQNRD